MGVAPDSAFRYQAGITHVLNGAAEDGHCFLPQTALVGRVVKSLQLPDAPVDPERITELIVEMGVSKQLIIQSGYGDLREQQICYTPAFYHTEVALATRLATFAQSPVDVDVERVQRWIDGYTQKMGITLSEQQRQAVSLAASSRLLVLDFRTGLRQDVHHENDSVPVACNGEILSVGCPNWTCCTTPRRND
jgi:exodeoxyribonuclease V alpha subunit